MASLSGMEKSLAIALASTGTEKKRRIKRPVDLVTLARHLKRLEDEYGTQGKVGEMIGISGRMVGQLMAALKCTKDVQRLISERKIDSADAVCKLAQWPRKDQLAFAEEIAKRKLESKKDVRAIVKLRMDNKLSVREAIRRVLDSKDKKVYAVLFFLDHRATKHLGDKGLERSLRREFERGVGRENLLGLHIRGSAILVRVTPAGMKLMKKEAKSLGIPLAELGNALLEGAVARKSSRRPRVARNK